jgi:nucleotide-binding universal stress UspA family protein
MYQNIVLAYDGSAESQQALLNCKEISQWQHARVHLLAVVPYELVSMGPESAFYNHDERKRERERYKIVLNEGVAVLTADGLDVHGQLRDGEAVDQILDYSQSVNADLIVLGHKHQDSWIERWWRGSVSKSLIEKSHCSVLIVILK